MQHNAGQHSTGHHCSARDVPSKHTTGSFAQTHATTLPTLTTVKLPAYCPTVMPYFCAQTQSNPTSHCKQKHRRRNHPRTRCLLLKLPDTSAITLPRIKTARPAVSAHICPDHTFCPTNHVHANKTASHPRPRCLLLELLEAVCNHIFQTVCPSLHALQQVKQRVVAQAEARQQRVRFALTERQQHDGHSTQQSIAASE